MILIVLSNSPCLNNFHFKSFASFHFFHNSLLHLSNCFTLTKSPAHKNPLMFSFQLSVNTTITFAKWSGPSIETWCIITSTSNNLKTPPNIFQFTKGHIWIACLTCPLYTKLSVHAALDVIKKTNLHLSQEESPSQEEDQTGIFSQQTSCLWTGSSKVLWNPSPAFGRRCKKQQKIPEKFGGRNTVCSRHQILCCWWHHREQTTGWWYLGLCWDQDQLSAAV